MDWRYIITLVTVSVITAAGAAQPNALMRLCFERAHRGTRTPPKLRIARRVSCEHFEGSPVFHVI